MNWPRPSIARLMTIVGVIALNIAALRFLLYSRMELAFGILPIAIALQIGLFQAIHSHGRSRVFWTGFCIAGTAAAASFIWAATFENSWLANRWNPYTFAANRFLHTYLPGLGLSMFSPNKLIIIATLAIIWFTPQLAAALIGGLSNVALVMRGRWNSSDDPKTRS